MPDRNRHGRDEDTPRGARTAEDGALVGSVDSETLSPLVQHKPVENREAWTETLQAVKDA